MSDATKNWLKRTGKVLLDYIELVAAGVAGIIVGVLGEIGLITGDHLTEVTLLVLGALSFGVVKERALRRRLSKRIDRAAALVAATRPLRVLYEDMKWDLESHYSATATAKKEVLFTQDEVVSIYEYRYSGTPGTDISRKYQGGIKGGPLQNLPVMHDDFPGPDGRYYRLISLQRVCHVGEIMQIESVRRLEGRFPDRRENVSREIAMPTTRLSIEVVWPTGLKPLAVWIERSGQPQQNIDVSRLRKRGGRWGYKEEFATPQPGERIALWWDWN